MDLNEHDCFQWKIIIFHVEHGSTEASYFPVVTDILIIWVQAIQYKNNILSKIKKKLKLDIHGGRVWSNKIGLQYDNTKLFPYIFAGNTTTQL